MKNYRVVAQAGRAELGEGPLWSPARASLFWVDILGHRLHRLSLADESAQSWQFDEPIGWAIERAGREDFIIGLKSGFARLSLDPFAVEPIGSPEPERPHNRLNDAKADGAGRIWAGSKDERDLEASGALYRLDPDLSWSRQDDFYLVANGPAFSPDGRTLYHSDSGRRTVHAFDLAADGSLSAKRTFLRFEEQWGYPDGMTADAEGGLWIAHWGGGRVSRFLPDGRLDRSIALPAANITSCAFAGPGLDRLFVTSARSDSEDDPHGGALFEVETGMRGLPPARFGG